MRITTWNVNGLRTVAPLAKRFASDLATSDIICVQETRVAPDDLDLEPLAFVPGYHSFFAACTARRGYSGVATFCRKQTATPCAATTRLDDAVGGAAAPSSAPCTAPSGACACEGAGYDAETLDIVAREGRVMLTDHGAFVLLNVYVPAVSDGARAPLKMRVLHALRAKVDALRAAHRRVVVAGDFNICPARIDSADQMNLALPHPAWLFRPTRRWLAALLDPADGRCVDAFRSLHPMRRAAYTCWAEATRGRETNFGVRIDLVVTCADLFRSVEQADIWAHVMGSDHCPVSVRLRDPDPPAPVPRTPPRACTQFWPRFAKRQRSVSEFLTARSGPPSSGGRAGLTFSTQSLTARVGRNVNGMPGQKRLTVNAKGVAEPGERAQKRRRVSAPKAAQTSLRSFFVVRESSKSVECTPEGDAATQNTAASDTVGRDVTERDDASLAGLDAATGDTAKREAPKHDAATGDIAKRDATQNAAAQGVTAKREATRLAWRKLLKGPPPPPRCRHGIPAVRKTVGKTGENRGRKFFACPYPRGAGRESNCEFFQWENKT